jgi:RNA polymerase sigma-70 factor (ECF subfamily)
VAQLSADTPSPSAELMWYERLRGVEAAMMRLPDDYRRVVELRFRDGREFTEIAAAMGRSENATRKLWFRAIERLQQELNGRL